MAIVQLKDVKVVSVFSKGFRVTEESKGRDGKDYVTRWTVWSDSLGVREGETVSLSGFLSAKVNEWEKDGVVRHSVELALNSPRLSGGADKAQPEWNTATTEPSSYDAESPF